MLNEVRKHLAMATVEPGTTDAKSVVRRLIHTFNLPHRGDAEILFGEVGLSVEPEGSDKIKIEFYDPHHGNDTDILVDATNVERNKARFAAELKEFAKKAEDADAKIKKLADDLGHTLWLAAEDLLKTVGAHGKFDVYFDPINDPDNDGNLTFAAYVRGKD